VLRRPARWRQAKLRRMAGATPLSLSLLVLLLSHAILGQAAAGAPNGNDGESQEGVIGRGGRRRRFGKRRGRRGRAEAPGALEAVSSGACGDGRCLLPETAENCMADCPGVTTPPRCGEEPHSDVGGYAVVWSASNQKATVSECCDACADPKNQLRPCNSWVFCHTLPYCWSLDTGNWHGFGECWLKHQTDARHPLYGQRGKFTDEFRRVHAKVAQDWPNAGRLTAQPLGADARAMDGRRAGRRGGRDRQMGDRTRRHEVVRR